MSPPVDKTPFEDEHEPIRKAFRDLSTERREPEHCPSPEETWDAVAGELELERIHRIIDHTSRCASCAEEWRLAHDMQRQTSDNHSTGDLAVGDLAIKAPEAEDADRVNAETVIQASHRFRRVVAPLIAIAAMLAVVIGLPQKDTSPPQYRAGQVQEIESLIADQILSRDAFILRWNEFEGALYDVLVSDADLQVLTRAQDLEDSSFQVPAEFLDGLEGEIYWQIEATLPGGSTQLSPTFVNQIAREDAGEEE